MPLRIFHLIMSDKRRQTHAVAPKRPLRIFSPFRVIGNVSNEVPFALGTLGLTFYIVTSVGRSFQIYDAATLHLLFVSQSQTASKITCLAAHHHYVYAGYGNKVGVYKRGRLIEELEAAGPIAKVLIFGEYLVATASTGDISVFRKSGGSKTANELYTTLNVNVHLDGPIVDVVHPATYLNKIVVTTLMHVLVFNVRTGKLLFRSEEFAEQIASVEAAPVLDILALGTAQGGIYIYNLKQGKVLGEKISVGSDARVVSLSFRTDGSPHLVAGLNSGNLFFYDLDRKARVHVLRSTHMEAHGGVANVKFLNGQPIVVTNGADNQLKEFVFDPAISSNTSITNTPRHLRSRGGHSAPPLAIEFPRDNKTHFVLSAGRDRSIWSFSLRKDAQAQEFSQRAQKNTTGKRKAGPVAAIMEKFPEVTAIACSHDNDWENVMTVHKDETFARTWDSKNKRVGRHQLETVDGGLAKAVCVSHCGNFGLVGSSYGGIASYNLQSGIRRKRYMLHKKEVTGLAIDGMNRRMVSTGLDGVVGFYDFTESKFLGKLQLEAPITTMVYHKSSDLIACALDDLTIVVVDVITQKVIRVLIGHTNRITSLTFSPDGRWIVSAGLDATLRTWDLPTGGCIDGVRLPSVATTVKFSPLGEFLATTHVAGNGISLWTNRAQFGHVLTRHIDEDEFLTILLPNVSGDGGTTMLDGALDGDEEQVLPETYQSVAQVDDLLTLANEARHKYSTLTHLDIIKLRNKPKEAPKKPKSAPFFLSLKGEAVGDRASVAEGVKHSELTEEVEEGSRLLPLKGTDHAFESEFTRLLRTGTADEYRQFVAFIVAAPPSLVDLEVRTLHNPEMPAFINALTAGLRRNTDFDVLQAIFSIFLKAHADVASDPAIQQSLDAWGEASHKRKDTLDDLVKYCSGVASFVTSY